jgi:SMC interacting uncharacterized protein involved in chromosome segregation
MNALRLESDEAHAKVEELQAKVKTLEQENLQKEQEITSLQHKNSVLESEVEKLEDRHKESKAAADESAQHGSHNESLQRRVQLLEEEAEEHDKNLRETTEKYVALLSCLSKGREAVGWDGRCGDSKLTIDQAPPNRHQSRPLRAQSPSPRTRQRQLGEEIRGNGQEILRHEEGAG